jgi:hypothetical protein
MLADHAFTRRGLFLLVGAGIGRLYAGASEFWDKKPPAEWTKDEIDRLLTKSPWAKEVTAQYAPGQGPDSNYPNGSGNPNGGGGYPGGRGGLSIPGIGGLGIPGMGGGRPRGRGGPGGGQTSAFHGTVRWESAQPVLDALKLPLADVFENRYVICVSGFPLLSERSQGSGGEAEDSEPNIDNLKNLTSLQVKGKDLVQAGVVRRQASTVNMILFGFAKEMLTIARRDSEIEFTSQIGRLMVKARFNPKEMLYHGDLAV